MHKANELRNFSSELRSNATKEERHLWYDYLKNYPVQFNRQKIIGAYIADFYCAKYKLVLELDGSQHFEEAGKQYDKDRSAFLNGLGITVMRFANSDIKTNFEGVCKAIDLKVSELSGSEPSD